MPDNDYFIPNPVQGLLDQLPNTQLSNLIRRGSEKGLANEGLYTHGGQILNPGGLMFSDKEKEQYLSELLRSIGTLQSQQLNRASDTAARIDLPASSQLAQERGIAIKGNQAIQQGTLDIERLQKSTNRQALQFLMELAFRRDALKRAEEQQNQQQTLGLISDIGSTAGYYLGGGVPGGGITGGSSSGGGVGGSSFDFLG